MSDFLKNKIDDTPDVTTEVDLGHGFVCTVRRLSPSARDEVVEARASIGRRGKVKYDRRGSARAWCKHALVGWEGLDRHVFFNVLKMVPKAAHVAAVEAFFKEHKVLPFGLDNAIELFLNANPQAFVEPITEAIDEMWEEDQTRKADEEDKST